MTDMMSAASTAHQKPETSMPKPMLSLMTPTSQKRKPFTMNEMRPSVRMYRGNATTRTKPPTTAFTTPQMRPKSASVPMTPHVESSNGITCTCDCRMRVTTQRATALMMMLKRARIPVFSLMPERTAWVG